MSAIDDLLDNAQRYASDFEAGTLALPPARRLAVVACMDARLNLYGLLGLAEGDAHLIRNAGGVVTQDVVRSLAISQRMLGTREVLLVHHTDCGMQTFTDDEFKATILAETGVKPSWAVEAFDDLDTDVRQSIARVRLEPAIPHRDQVRGVVYDVTSGKLREVR